MKQVLVLSGTASAINYIKSLAGEPDLRLHVTDTDPYCPGLYAPGVIPHWLPRARDTKAYRAALDRLVTEEAIDVLIPTSDYDVAAVVDYLHDGWSPPLALFHPPWAAHQCLAHKQRLTARLTVTRAELVPRTWRSDEASAAACPVVVKPVAESGGKGVSVVRDPADLPPALARARGLYGDDYIIQQYIPGRTYVVTLVFGHDGEVVVAAAMRSHLTFFTWGGGGCAGELVDDPEPVRLSIEAINACGGWRGPINLEWQRHEATGRYYLFEANCRLNGYSYLTTMNGLCLPKVVLSLLTGTPLPSLELAPPPHRSNFALGFRETLVDRWIE
jgi:carbamoylphosphate synthase large subunit